MSFYDDASLVFLPSGEAGKDGKAYSMKPTNGDGDFTFSRGSNLTATRVDSNGLIEKGRENLLLQSNQFDTTAWNISNVSGGQEGYDGTNDAWLQSGTSRLQQAISLSTGVYTFSLYLKGGYSNYCEIRIAGSTSIVLRYELTGNGSIITSSNAIDSKIDLIGNGWYKVSGTFNASVTTFRIYPKDDSSGSQSSSSSVYIQDTQLEIGLTSTEYIESGATTGLAGLLEDSPRFDFSGGASCPSLLLEPSRTNLIGYSEYLGGLGESGSPNLSLESEINPSGSLFSYKATATTTTSRIQEPIGTQGNNFIFSGFFKGSGVATRIRFRNNQGEGVYYNIDTSGNFTLYSEDIVNDNYGIEDYGNGWKRIYFETTTASGGTNNYLQLYIDVQDGDGSVLVWGLQAEQGSYPTSYIPNHSGGSVTREADSFEKTGLSSVIGQTEGTIFFEFEYSHQQVNTPFFRVFENASNLYEIIALSSFKLRSRARIGGSIVAAIDTASVVAEGTHKVAIIYKSREYKFYLDGSLVGSSTENSIVSNPSQINYFNNNNNLKQFLLFPTALSDSECITLTS